MFYDPLITYSQQPVPYSSLPNIHPESVDCIVRSELISKGSLYVGNLEAVQNPETLRSKVFLNSELKVSSVLTCAEGYRLDHSEDIISNYKYFPLPENPIFDLNEYFNESTEFIKQALSRSNCIVHCLTGENKSIAVVIAYLIKQYAMGIDDALAYVSRKRKLVNIDEKYLQALQSFFKFIKEKVSPKSNQNQNHTIPYKTQNSLHEKYVNGSQISQTQRSKTNQSKFQENNKSNLHLQQLQKSSATLKNEEKLRISPEKKTSQHHHSRFFSESPEINSVPNSKDLSFNQKNQVKIEKNNTQASKSKTENKSRHGSFSVDHKEAIRFDNILISNQQKYIGVKREYKNSITSSKKERGSIINFSSISQGSNLLLPEEKKFDLLQVSKELEKSQISDKKSLMNENSHVRTQRSEQKSFNKQKSVHKNSRVNTKLTEIGDMKYSHLRILNPENEEANVYAFNQEKKSSMRIKSGQSVSSLNASQIRFRNSHVGTESEELELSKILSTPFKGTESRKEYFWSVNEELNSNVKQISTSYEAEIADLRINYQNRLRHLKKPQKNQVSISNGNSLSSNKMN